MLRSMTLGLVIASTATMPATASAATIYSSLALSGAAAGQTRAVNDGARQALQEAGGTAGGQAIAFVTLNDASKRAGSWVPELVARNARRVAQDEAALAVIGPFNSRAAAGMIPITKQARVPGVGPSHTANR